MFNILQSFLLAQTAQEKQITLIGIAVFALFMFCLVIDSVAKNKVIPKKGPLKSVVIVMFLIAVIVVILLTKVYK